MNCNNTPKCSEPCGDCTQEWPRPDGAQSPAEGDGNVLVPLTLLEDASSALGNFVSDHGWSDEDMQAMDNLDAFIAQHKANVAANVQPKHTDEPLFLLHCGQIDSGGEQGDWDIEADSGKRVDEFCRLHPGQTINLHPHVQSPAPGDAPAAHVSSLESGSPLMCGLSDWESKGLVALYTRSAPCAAVGDGEERRQLQHLLDDIVEEADQDGHTYYRIRDGADVLFSNMVSACARLLAQPAAQAIAADADPIAVVESATGGPKGLPLLLWMVDLPCMDAKVQAGDKLYLHPGKGKLSIRQLTDEELAACCGGCRSNSAIETWMRRAVAKFCEVNGISHVPVQGSE